MSSVLTSWKDIAQYMGKGVRTVQRWEADFGLPVHRPANSPRHVVVALPEEIDDWIRRQVWVHKKHFEPDVERLLAEIGALRRENAELRHRLSAWEPDAFPRGQDGAEAASLSDSGLVCPQS